MPEWARVVTEPLGLVGFALFLVFGILSRVKRQDERRWLSPLAAIMAVVVLAAGLGLAFLQVQQKSAAAKSSASAEVSPPAKTSIITTGDGSPVVSGAGGPVTITIDQSSGASKTAKKAEKKSP